MAYLSTQASLNARAGVNRVKLFGDKDRDGTVDPTTLEQALEYGDQQVKGHLSPRYGSQVNAWDSATAGTPTICKRLSDDICLYWLSTSVPIGNPTIKEAYESALSTLNLLSSYVMNLPEISDQTDYDTVTGEMDDVFEDESCDSDNVICVLT